MIKKEEKYTEKNKKIKNILQGGSFYASLQKS